MAFLNTCCCFFSIRTGTLVLLYLNVTRGIMTIFSPEIAVVQPDGQKSIYIGNEIKIGLAVIIVIAAIAGLYGVHRNKAMFVFGYLLVEVLTLIIYIIITILCFIAASNNKSKELYGLACGYLFYVGLSIYLTAVACSYYHSL